MYRESSRKDKERAKIKEGFEYKKENATR